MTYEAVNQDAVPTLVGIPLDVNSSYLRGPAEAPGQIREALCAGCFERMDGVWGRGRGVRERYGDAGDLQLSNTKEQLGADFAEIERAVGALLEKDERPVSLGGDHSVTYPIVKAFARLLSGVDDCAF